MRFRTKISPTFFLLFAILLAVKSLALTGWRPTARLALVHQGRGPDTLYNYFAAAPAFVFRYGDVTYQAPILADAVSDDTVKYFFEMYRGYLQSRGGLKGLVAVGAVEAADVEYVRRYFDLARDSVREIVGPPPRVAREISRDWVASEYVVVAPYVAAPTVHDVESAANAASVAAFLNAPLFYAEPEGLSAETLEYIAHLAPSKAVVVEIDDRLPSSVNADLKEAGARVTADLTTERDVVTYVNGLTDPAPPVLCCFRGRGMAAPAALAAARYGGFVLELPYDFVARSSTVWGEVQKEKLPCEWRMLEDYVLPASIRDGEEEIANHFYAWLEKLGGTDPNQLEYVLTFARAFGEESLSYVFDRSIMGYTEKPRERGAVPGRFVNPPPASLASLNLTSAYRALIFANPRPRHVTFCGSAYLAVNKWSEHGYFKDEFGNDHGVNEVLGYHEGGYDDPGVFDDFRDGGYKAVVHDGVKPGAGRHPFVPYEDLLGIEEDLQRGGSFFYASCHGSSEGIKPFEVDTGVAANVEWGKADWPGGSTGMVDYSGPVFTCDRWDEVCGNNAGLVAVFNACSVGAGDMNAVVTRHLGAASISSYALVPYVRHSWFGICLVNRLVKRHYTVGEALSFATAQVSEIFPRRDGLPPMGVRYVLVGDPFMHYYRPTWRPPTPAPPGRNYGGHNPGGAGSAPDYGKATFALAQNYPNPVRGTTTIVFVVPNGPATLTVYDMRGAAVRRLWKGTAAAGGHRVTWDGAGDDGAPLPPGVYLYRLEAGGRAAVKRMVLIR